jgi:hypothetical protein
VAVVGSNALIAAGCGTQAGLSAAGPSQKYSPGLIETAPAGVIVHNSVVPAEQHREGALALRIGSRRSKPLSRTSDNVRGREVHTASTLREGLADTRESSAQLGVEANDQLVLGGSDDRLGHLRGPSQGASDRGDVPTPRHRGWTPRGPSRRRGPHLAHARQGFALLGVLHEPTSLEAVAERRPARVSLALGPRAVSPVPELLRASAVSPRLGSHRKPVSGEPMT